MSEGQADLTRTRLLLMPLLLSALLAPLQVAAEEYERPDLLVETSWLDENLIDPRVIVIDLRDQERYTHSHIPNSYWLDDLSLFDRGAAPSYVLPPDRFKNLMESVGVGEGAHVIAVDEIGGRSASTLWWALGYYGFDEVSILNGGFTKWQMEGRALTAELPLGRAATFEPALRPERAATAELLVKARNDGVELPVLDARRPREYTGGAGKRRRPGHIPGAVNVPWPNSLGREGTKTVFKPQSELLKIFREAGVSGDSPWVAYCSDGRRASHLLFVATLIGLGSGGQNYVGGWDEWSGREDLPVERGGAKEGSKARSKARGGATGVP